MTVCESNAPLLGECDHTARRDLSVPLIVVLFLRFRGQDGRLLKVKIHRDHAVGCFRDDVRDRAYLNCFVASNRSVARKGLPGDLRDLSPTWIFAFGWSSVVISV